MISVIIPVFNGEEFLKQAIESILIQEGDHELEIIVVDDGSTDRSAEIARTFPVTVLKQPNQGPSGAKNSGILNARGEILAFLDADDLWSKDKLNIQVPLLENSDIVMGHSRRLKEENYSEPFTSTIFGSALIRKKAFEKVGLFEGKYCEDVDWFMRAREAAIPILITKHIVHTYRIHTNNLTHHDNMNHHCLTVLHKSLQRRRAYDHSHCTGV